VSKSPLSTVWMKDSTGARLGIVISLRRET
jgi:hypothetical protein